MSTDHFRGTAWAVKTLMQQAQQEIDRGDRVGAVRIWTASDERVRLGDYKARLARRVASFLDHAERKYGRRR